MPYRERLIAAVKAGGLLFTEGYRAHKEVSFKSDIDLVTQYDVAVEALLKTRLAESFPGYTLVGEESSGTVTYPEKAIYIDPIDGTTNFVHGIPFCAISVGIWKISSLSRAASTTQCSTNSSTPKRGRGQRLTACRYVSTTPGP